MAKIDIEDSAHTVIKKHCEIHGITVKEWASKLLVGAATRAKVERGKRLERLSNEGDHRIWHRPPFWAHA